MMLCGVIYLRLFKNQNIFKLCIFVLFNANKFVHYNGSSMMHPAVFQTSACHDVTSRGYSGGETAVLLSKADCQFGENLKRKYLQGYRTSTLGFLQWSHLREIFSLKRC